MAIKKKKLRKALFYIMLKWLKTKQRNLNEGKFGLKPSFKKEKTKVLSTRRYKIYVSQIGRSPYDYSDLNSEYFADLYCYLRKYF